MPTAVTALAKEMSGYLSSPDCGRINSSVTKLLCHGCPSTETPEPFLLNRNDRYGAGTIGKADKTPGTVVYKEQSR